MQLFICTLFSLAVFTVQTAQSTELEQFVTQKMANFSSWLQVNLPDPSPIYLGPKRLQESNFQYSLDFELSNPSVQKHSTQIQLYALDANDAEFAFEVFFYTRENVTFFGEYEGNVSIVLGKSFSAKGSWSIVVPHVFSSRFKISIEPTSNGLLRISKYSIDDASLPTDSFSGHVQFDNLFDNEIPKRDGELIKSSLYTKFERNLDNGGRYHQRENLIRLLYLQYWTQVFAETTQEDIFSTKPISSSTSTTSTIKDEQFTMTTPYQTKLTTTLDVMSDAENKSKWEMSNFSPKLFEYYNDSASLLEQAHDPNMCANIMAPVVSDLRPVAGIWSSCIDSNTALVKSETGAVFSSSPSIIYGSNVEVITSITVTFFIHGSAYVRLHLPNKCIDLSYYAVDFSICDLMLMRQDGVYWRGVYWSTSMLPEQMQGFRIEPITVVDGDYVILDKIGVQSRECDNVECFETTSPTPEKKFENFVTQKLNDFRAWLDENSLDPSPMVYGPTHIHGSNWITNMDCNLSNHRVEGLSKQVITNYIETDLLQGRFQVDLRFSNGVKFYGRRYSANGTILSNIPVGGEGSWNIEVPSVFLDSFSISIQVTSSGFLGISSYEFQNISLEGNSSNQRIHFTYLWDNENVEEYKEYIQTALLDGFQQYVGSSFGDHPIKTLYLRYWTEVLAETTLEDIGGPPTLPTTTPIPCQLENFSEAEKEAAYFGKAKVVEKAVVEEKTTLDEDGVPVVITKTIFTTIERKEL